MSGSQQITHVTIQLSHLLLTKGQKQCITHTINTVLEESPGYRRLKTIKDPRKQKKVRVATFLTSNKDSTRGIVPIVQSQHNSEGFRRSQAFTGRRQLKVSCLAGDGLTAAGLSNLKQKKGEKGAFNEERYGLDSLCSKLQSHSQNY